MLKSLFCEDISVEYEFSHFSLYLSGNTTEFKTLPTRPRYIFTSIYIVLYIRDGFCQNLSF